jgi:hypothetical protein
MVVDLAVLHHPHRRVLVVDRLVATLEVDDGKAPHAQRYAVEVDTPLIVRPAVLERGAHAPHQLTTRGHIAAGDPADPAHLSGGAD